MERYVRAVFSDNFSLEGNIGSRALHVYNSNRINKVKAIINSNNNNLKPNIQIYNIMPSVVLNGREIQALALRLKLRIRGAWKQDTENILAREEGNNH